MTSLLKRKIEVDIALDGDTFDGSANMITVKGLRCFATVLSYAGSTGSFASQLEMRIHGMLTSDMAKLSTLGLSSGTYKKNVIRVRAGDELNGLAQVFEGGIVYGNVDFNAMPDVGVELVASAFASAQYSKTAGNSFKGATNVASILQSLANTAGWGFSNAGVTAVLNNHAMGGTVVDQIRDVCRAAGVQAIVENNTLFIWPNGGSRDNSVIQVSPENGLVGYPQYIVNGIAVRTLFQPDAMVGRYVKVTTSTPAPAANAPLLNGQPAQGANGTFYTWAVTHELSSETYNGPWFTSLKLGNNKFNAH